jgi:hypothetical protein
MAKRKTQYPTGNDRLGVEVRIMSCCSREKVYQDIIFLTPKDFQYTTCRKQFQIFEEAKGNYKQMVKIDQSFLDMFLSVGDLSNYRPLAILLVEMNISIAIIGVLEAVFIESKDQLEMDFLRMTIKEAMDQDALKLHAGILTYIKPIVSKWTYIKVERIVNRISKRLVEIKKVTDSWD